MIEFELQLFWAKVITSGIGTCIIILIASKLYKG